MLVSHAHDRLLLAEGTLPQPLNGGINTEAGNDISGAIWLSADYPTSISQAQIKQWVAKYAPKMRENNPMLFLYGEKDATQKRDSSFFYDQVLVAKGSSKLGVKTLDQTFMQGISNNKLSGSEIGRAHV